MLWYQGIYVQNSAIGLNPVAIVYSHAKVVFAREISLFLKVQIRFNEVMD